MAADPEDHEHDGKPKSHWLLWLIVGVFLLLSIVGMWSIDYFFSPEVMAEHQIHDSAED